MLCHNLLCCHSVRQWWLWCIEQRRTGCTTLQKNDLIATGCRDACSLNMTRTTAWCSVSGVVALIRMSVGTSLSKGTVQWTVKVAQRCKSICIILVFIEFVLRKINVWAVAIKISLATEFRDYGPPLAIYYLPLISHMVKMIATGVWFIQYVPAKFTRTYCTVVSWASHIFLYSLSLPPEIKKNMAGLQD